MSICCTCHGGCCRKFNIHLTGYDILNISKNLNLNYMHFTQVLPVNEERMEKTLKHTAFFKFPNLGDGYYGIFLRLINSRHMPDSLKCMFLQEWNDKEFMLPDLENITARCGIYENRPLTCAVYPAKMSIDGLTGLTGDPNKIPGTMACDNPAYNLCPRSLDERDFADHSGSTIKNLVLYKYEVEYFKAVSEIWNNNPGDFGKFFMFLEMAYKNRVLYETQD